MTETDLPTASPAEHSAARADVAGASTDATGSPVPSGDVRRRGRGEASATLAAHQSAHKGGAPAGNSNAAKHSVWSFLALGKLPKGASYIRRLMGELRRSLEQAVVAAHSQLSLTHAATITTVCRHEGRALLLSRYLANEGGGLKVVERMSLLEAIGRATDARDKAIRQLDLDRDTTADPWAAYDAHLARQRAQQAITSDSAAQSAKEASQGQSACNSVLGHHNSNTLAEGAN